MNKNDIQALQKGLENFNNFLLDLFYPPVCVMCGRLSSEGLCEECKKDYPINLGKRCLRCSKFIEDVEKEYCQDCIKVKKHFIQGVSLWKHSGRVKQSVYRFKYQNHRVYAKVYANLLVKVYGDKLKLWAPQAILGVPVHRSRERSRGYNQAHVLSKAIVSEIRQEFGLDIPEITHYTYRDKNTGFQKVLDDKQRIQNLQGVFGLKEGIVLPEKVLIIDDIYTTGATLNELAKLLKKNGVKDVYFMCISIGQGV